MDNSSDMERAEYIDRYVAGHLSAEERRAFEAHLSQDQRLRQAYEDIKLSQVLAQDYGLRDEIKAIRQAMHQEMATPIATQAIARTPTAKEHTTSEPDTVRPLFRPVSRYIRRIAAGVAILLVGFLGFQYATLSNDDLYAEKMMPYQVAASRSAEEPVATPAYRLEQAYQSQRFGEVTAAYEQMNNPSLMEVFLAGNAYLQEEKTAQAIDAFRQIVAVNGSQGISRFEEDAQYYLALSYLKANRIEEALPLLEAINANPQHSYHSLVTDYYLWKVKLLNSMQ